MVSIPVDMSALVDGDLIDAADVRTPLNNLKAAIDDTLNGDQEFDQINFGSAPEVTISGGVIEIDGHSYLRVDTEANAASDDLDTINGGAQGDVLYLRLEDAARVVVVKHNTGNIYIGTTDYQLDGINKTLKLFYNGSKWTPIGSSDAETLSGYTVTEIVDAITAGSGLSSTSGPGITRTFSWSAPSAIVEEQQPSGTSGGTFTSGAWRTRVLNTITSYEPTGTQPIVSIRRIAFTSGSDKPAVGDRIEGATSGAYSTVFDIESDEKWNTGIAQGYIWLNTQGGAFVAENLNNTTQGENNFATVTGDSELPNLMRVSPGVYLVKAGAPACGVDNHQCGLYSYNRAIIIALGTAEYAPTTALAQTRSFLCSAYQLDSYDTFELQHRCATTRATNGLGVASSFSISIVFSQVEWLRIGAV